MATIRRAGFGSVFEVENETIGIGTTGTATNTVQALGETKTSNILVSGLSTLTTYQGFVDSNAEFGNTNVDINSQSGSIGNIEICHGDFNVSSASTLTSSINELTLTNSFSVPTGNTDSRIHCHTAGSMRFNEDLGTLEFYTGDEWRTVNSFKDTGNRGRALFCGGDTTPSGDYISLIDFCNISSTGSTRNFGDATSDHMTSYGIGNDSRGIFHVGGGPSNTLEYVTIPSEGNSIDFGNLSSSRYAGSRGNSSTRGVFMGGSPGPSNVIDYVEMMTLGNALDFGDLNVGVYVNPNSINSRTRAFSLGGYISPGINTSNVEFVTISSKGNASNFGTIDRPLSSFPGFSNNTRGIYGGGILRPGATSKIFIFNMFTQGETTFFGDLIQARYEFAGSCSQTRGVFAGGQTPASPYPSVNTMDFVTMASTGNAVDFGDMSKGARNLTSLSDCHGGLGGF